MYALYAKIVSYYNERGGELHTVCDRGMNNKFDVFIYPGIKVRV